MLEAVEGVTIKTVKTFDFDSLYKLKDAKRPKGNPHGRKAIYKDIICAFDIETTRLEDIEQSFMYIWQFQFGPDITIIGRTWEEFIYMLKEFKKRLRGRYICVFIHNASFEFQFLKGIYHFEPSEVFAADSRKIIKCTMFDAIEFRCSYYHSNMSLAQYLSKMGVEHEKQTGFDYDKKRYPWTELDGKELLYCINDVRGLVEAIMIEMKKDGDSLYTFPLTSTGYVRRDCRAAMENYNHKQLAAMLPSPQVYILLREAFRGGDVHGNRYYADDILKDVHSVDRSSSYPDVMLNRLFPMGEFKMGGYMEFDQLERFIYKYKRAVLFRFKVENIRERNPYCGRPYLSFDKCRNVCNYRLDNGRIMNAEYLETTITDVDYRILKDCYTWERCEAEDVFYTRYGKLPKQLTDVIRQYYINKTSLKGVAGSEWLYMKSKNKLNACYGMAAQDPVKDTIDFIDEDVRQYVPQDKPIEYLLARSNKRAFLCYQWGVWVTSWARFELHEMCKIVGEDFVYCDTDSVKFIGEHDFTAYNERCKAASLESGAFADDPAGKRHYMGVAEDEGIYREFKTLGAKKYVYTDSSGKLHITIAGVNKDKGPEELGSIENFAPGFTFYEAGGTESVYNDMIDNYITREGRQIRITDNVVIRPSTKTLGLSAEYAEVLRDIASVRTPDLDIIGISKVKHLQ